MDPQTQKPPMTALRLAIGAHSDTGRKRSRNEDRVGSDPDRGIVVLADGMGGHNGGEIASELAVNTILEHLAAGLDELPAAHTADTDETGCSPHGNLSREAIEAANSVIFQAAEQAPEYEGMGTTVVVALLQGERISISHVGDSRLYRLRDGQLELLTSDHTLMQELIERGFYTPEEARESLNRNIVTRALGIEPEVTIDLLEEHVQAEDLYLLCSDGLTEMVTDEDIAAIIRAGAREPVAVVAERLVDTANRNGGSDNISAILVRVGSGGGTGANWRQRFLHWIRGMTRTSQTSQ